MMVDKQVAAQLHKAKRFIIARGETLVFKEVTTNEFGEPEEGGVIYPVEGVWTNTNVFIKKNTSDGATINSKKSPQVFTLIDDTTANISKGCTLERGGVKYTVTDLNNINGYGLFMYISLEECV